MLSCLIQAPRDTVYAGDKLSPVTSTSRAALVLVQFMALVCTEADLEISWTVLYLNLQSSNADNKKVCNNVF